jgi:NAD-dependent DNA ligase
MDFICTYVNSAGIGSIQHLINIKFDDEENPQYVQGFCHQANHPKTLRYDRVIQVFESYDAAKSIFGEESYKLPEYDKTPSTRYSSPETMDVCFTGFAKTDKETLTQLAESNNMFVRAGVTKHLDILCYGYNAGPTKLAKAMDQGVFILNKSQFEIMIETGEVPEDV